MNKTIWPLDSPPQADHYKISALLVMILLGGLGCGVMDSHRRHSYVSKNPELSREQKEDILKGRLQAGMTRDTVRASLGRPTETSAHTTWKNIIQERWFYDQGDETIVVEFENGRVTGWTQKKKEKRK